MITITKTTMIMIEITTDTISATRGVESVMQDAAGQALFCSTTIRNVIEFLGKAEDETTKV